MKQLVLVTFDSNWADEMDVNGFALMELSVWNNFCARIKKEIFTKDAGVVEFGIGTNEELRYESYASWKGDFKVKKVSNSEATVISKAFGLKIKRLKGKDDYDLDFDYNETFGFFAHMHLLDRIANNESNEEAEETEEARGMV
jgi:hypothetical protein